MFKILIAAELTGREGGREGGEGELQITEARKLTAVSRLSSPNKPWSVYRAEPGKLRHVFQVIQGGQMTQHKHFAV